MKGSPCPHLRGTNDAKNSVTQETWGITFIWYGSLWHAITIGFNARASGRTVESSRILIGQACCPKEQPAYDKNNGMCNSRLCIAPAKTVCGRKFIYRQDQPRSPTLDTKHLRRSRKASKVEYTVVNLSSRYYTDLELTIKPQEPYGELRQLITRHARSRITSWLC